jgi:AraC family transcriptional regulator of adaptative response/methylated-DNA-[protein]-cysteine methyltransferase
MTNETYWQAVLTRDRGADGTFVYGVRSTGVYCRPSCPARRPGREQVIFFPTLERAEEAGFRPCRRCHPRDVDAQRALVEAACRTIETHLDGPLPLAVLGRAVGSSPYHLHRVFKRVMGLTPREYAAACRLDTLKARLREGEEVTNALYDAGYGSSRGLYEQALGQLGMTPATYRRRGGGMQIGYTIVDSPLGRLLVAATERGLCAVYPGDSDAALEAALRREYPAAGITAADGRLGPWVAAILRHLEGQPLPPDLPLDVQATAFQGRVWAALRAIPYGDTRSYGAVAAALGEQKAARAVAGACARNPVALVIPCHRVVQEDGGLGGYRWGVARKRQLLEQEHIHHRDTENTEISVPSVSRW